MIAFSYDRPVWEKNELTSGGYPQVNEVYVVNLDDALVHRLTDLASPTYRSSGSFPDWSFG
jgi:hypothetical protein